MAKPRHEGGTKGGKLFHSTLVSNETDTFFAWCFWQTPLEIFRANNSNCAMWLEIRARELMT